MARSLTRAGYRVSIATRDAGASGFRTGAAVDRVVLPDPAVDIEVTARALVAWLLDHPADVLLCSTDGWLALLDGHRATFEGISRPAIASVKSIAIAGSKERTLALAARLGIPAPRSRIVSTPAEVEDVTRSFGYPCVLKPNESWRPIAGGGERVAPVLLDGPEAARRQARALVRPDAPALVQELATGERETHKFFVVDDRIVARLVMVSDRTWPPLGGSSVMRRTVAPPPDSAAYAEALVHAIGLVGYCEVEFRRDGAGLPLLMEVNARLSQSVELSTRAGVDFPRMQLEWARGGCPPAPGTVRYGARVGWLPGEMRFLGACLARRPVPAPSLRPTLRAIAGDYLGRGARVEGLDRHDLAPTVAALAMNARGGVERLLRWRRAA